MNATKLSISVLIPVFFVLFFITSHRAYSGKAWSNYQPTIHDTPSRFGFNTDFFIGLPQILLTLIGSGFGMIFTGHFVNVNLGLIVQRVIFHFSNSDSIANPKRGGFYNERILEGPEKLSADVVHIWTEMQESLVIFAGKNP